MDNIKAKYDERIFQDVKFCWVYDIVTQFLTFFLTIVPPAFSNLITLGNVHENSSVIFSTSCNG